MPSAQDLLKNQKVHFVDAEQTVLEAARLMMEHNFGAVPVTRNGELVGIFSERDIMTRVVADARTPGATKIAEVMTPNPKSVAPNESVEDCLFLMREYGFRHLLVMEGKDVKGVVSLRDILVNYLSARDLSARKAG
jgi:CBS domain-containing protein